MEWWGFEVRRGVVKGGHRRDLRCETTKSRTEGNLPMALSQSALSELLDAFRAGDGVDLVRESVRMVLRKSGSKPKPPNGSAPDATNAPTPV